MQIGNFINRVCLIITLPNSPLSIRLIYKVRCYPIQHKYTLVPSLTLLTLFNMINQINLTIKYTSTLRQFALHSFIGCHFSTLIFEYLVGNCTGGLLSNSFWIFGSQLIIATFTVSNWSDGNSSFFLFAFKFWFISSGFEVIDASCELVNWRTVEIQNFLAKIKIFGCYSAPFYLKLAFEIIQVIWISGR